MTTSVEHVAPAVEDDKKHHPHSGEEEDGVAMTKPKVSRFEQDDPFVDDATAEVHYRTLTWWQAALLMIAETISLGILSLPSVLASLGLVAGVVLIVGLGILATYCGYVYGQFKTRYPGVANMADAGEVLMGAWGREIFGTAQIIMMIFILASHLLTFTIAMNVITGHATCTIVWGVVGLLLFFILSLPRTLKNVSYLSIAAFTSIIGAVFTTIIAVGIEAPNPILEATTKIGFASAFAQTLNICFAYAGQMAYFSFMSEMRDPREFPKALITLQTVEVALYVIAAVVIYRFAGPDVASPALGSTGPVVKKVAYGIALPTILIAGVIYANVAAKQIYVRIFRNNTRRIHERSFVSIGTWVAIIACLWIIGWIIAESIPVFNDLNALISALFISWFTYGLAGVFWLYMNYGYWFMDWRKSCLTVLNVFLIGMGAAICGIGLYASGTAINQDAGQGASWSCGDNS